MFDSRRNKNNRINQGDIFSNITHIENWEEKDNVIKISRIHYPYIVILSQDCDLEQDINARKNMDDKALVSVLVAPLYNFDQFLNGDHLIDLGITACRISPSPSKSDHKSIIQNNNPRFHYMSFDELPRLIVDFKHYFSLSMHYLDKIKDSQYEYPIPYLHRELLCQRFANYLSRIGLPV